MSLPQVFLDITADGEILGRLIFELKADTVPRTAENFRALCTGEKGYGYKNSKIHRIVPNYAVFGGDFTRGNGTGGHSIYGDKFSDENFVLKHAGRGVLTMANSGPHTNNSQFMLTVTKTEWLNGKQVVFGQMIKGDEVLKKIEVLGTQSGKTLKEVRIANSGMWSKDMPDVLEP